MAVGTGITGLGLGIMNKMEVETESYPIEVLPDHLKWRFVVT